MRKYLSPYDGPGVWDPSRQGTWTIRCKAGTPRDLARWWSWRPIATAGLARAWLDWCRLMSPHLADWLVVCKMPFTLATDHPDDPGGSCIEIPESDLPPAEELPPEAKENLFHTLRERKRKNLET